MRNRVWLKIAFLQFVLVAIIGLLIRFSFLGIPVGFSYKNLLHTHSHIGFLGWVSMAIFVGFVQQFVPSGEGENRFRRIFLFTEVTILGMLFSFPIQGYGAVSITFSTLFLVASYWFSLRFLRQINNRPSTLISIRFAKAAILYLVISSLGPWLLGPLVAMGHGHKDIYYLVIFFYLHFLYNGFIMMALLAFIFKLAENKGLSNDLYRRGMTFYRWTHLAVIPTYALSTLWTNPASWLYWVGVFFAGLQLAAIWYFFPIGKNVLESFKSQSRSVYFLIVLAGISFFSKVVLQFLSAFPVLAKHVNSQRPTIIMGYIHLVTLGVISSFLIGLFVHQGGFKMKYALSKVGVFIFIVGFIGSELLLFGQGVQLFGQAYYQEWLTGFSALMPVGLLLFGVEIMVNRND